MEDQNKDIMPEGQSQTETPQVEQTWMESSIYTTPDVYQTQSGTEVYQSQTVLDVYQSSDMSEENHGMGGLFSGEQSENSMDGSVYGENKAATDEYVDNLNNNNGMNGMGGNQYQYGNNGMDGNQYQYGNNGMDGNQYQYGNNGMDGNQYQYGNNGMDGNQYQYGNNGMNGNQNQYGNNGIYGNQYQYGNNGLDGNQYQYGNNGMNGNQNQYGNNGMNGNQNQYGNNGMNGNQYQYGNSGASGNQYQYGNNGASGNQYQYGNNGASGNQYQYGNPYVYNQNGYNYSPYATPQKKKQTGLVIGIIIAIVVVFLIAFLAIIYNAFKNIYSSTERVTVNNVLERTDNDTDRDNDDNRNSNNNRGSNGYDRDDKDYDDDDYYDFHDEIKNNLSYSIEWEYFDYDTDDKNVSIKVDYPVIVGDDVPNLDKLNAAISSEASYFSEYYEEEYSKYMDENGNSYFDVTSTGYVTYMSESVLSVAFQEKIDSNFFGAVYVYCINIDMNAGVVMENTDIIEVDDDFSVDFRYRSEEQNGTISELDGMSDQEITKYLQSEDNLIIFYTPQGMEIGINYGDGYGWVTVTYHDYKKYLKVF